MTTYTWPDALVPSASTWTLLTNTRRFSSPLTNATQTVARKGTMWRADLTFNNLTTENRGALQAFISKLEGQVHRVSLQDHAFVRQGAGGGTPRVAGASQSGSTVNIDGASTSITDWLLPGDLLSFDNQLFMCTAACNTDPSLGSATVSITPPIRQSPPNDSLVEITTPRGVFMLVTDPSWNNRAGANIVSSFSMTFLEDVLASAE